MEQQTLMENEMSSQTLVRSNATRFDLVRYAASTFACRINGHIAVLIGRFMAALCETRQRQADQAIRQYRHLIDGSNN